MRFPFPSIPALLLGTILAGCAEPPAAVPEWFEAEASQPILMPPPGVPYDGTGMLVLNGTLKVRTNDKNNSGLVDLYVEGMGLHYRVKWTNFKEQTNASWQDGGIETDLVEHGASGRGNKMEPQFNVLSAGWGTAGISLHDAPLSDPVTGNRTFMAHYMVTREAMMDPVTHKIYKADKTTPFDPATPGDGYVFPDRKEAHLSVWGQGAFKDGLAVLRPAPKKTTLGDTATGPTYTKQFPITVEAVSEQLRLFVNLTGGTGKLTVTLKDPAGNRVAQDELAPDSMQVQLAPPAGSLAVGTWTLEVAGIGAQGAWSADVHQTPPVPFLVHFVFGKVALRS